MDNTSYRVVQYNSWTEWSTSSNIDTKNILYSGPTVNCLFKEIRDMYTTSKYIIVLKQD